jgi:ELWxxDGT repeat protein
MHLRPLPLLVLLLWTVPLAAAPSAPHLVKDINTAPAPASSSPADFITVNGVTFFTADDGDTGRELWRTDGTAAGTYRLTDACPLECSSNPTYFAYTDHSYFFLAENSDDEGYSLWVSGGTAANTVKLTTSPLGFSRDYSQQTRWVVSQGLLYFSGNDGTHGNELWRTDGTAAGTYAVTDLYPGLYDSNPREMVEFNHRLYFVADDGVHGPSLWKSDGTPQGTQLVRDPVPALAGHSSPFLLQVVGRFLYFFAPTPAHGVELWKSDGTTRGTAPLADLSTGAGFPIVYGSIALGNRLLFVADAGAGQQLWATDGTPAGTRTLTRFSPPGGIFSPDPEFQPEPLNFPLWGNRRVFLADDGVHGTELWTTDGTPAGTALVRDVCPGPCAGADFPEVPFGSHLLFKGITPARGEELWVTDGTSSGTRLLRDLCRGSCSPALDDFDQTSREVFFTSRGAGSDQLWRTDGTAPGTLAIGTFRSLSPPVYGFTRGILGNDLLFSADDGVHGFELWKSDGTAQGTQLLMDINTHNVGGSYPSELHALGNDLLFFADDGTKEGLWKSDGTDSGTLLVRALVPLGSPQLPEGSILADQAAGDLFMILTDETGAPALWRSDGTSAGTIPLPTGSASVGSSLNGGGFLALGGTLFFSAFDTGQGPELWKSDGTPGGTVLVKDIDPGATTPPEAFAAFQGRLYFTAQTANEGNELWVSDGTEPGTHLLKDINATGPGISSNPSLLTLFGGRLWFTADDGQRGDPMLWSTDGTAAGTVPMDLVPGSVLDVETMMPVGARLFFVGGTSFDDSGLWITDGTAAGTQHLSSVAFANTFTGGAAALGNVLFFSGIQSSSSSEAVLWRSDGTAAGTVPLLDAKGNSVPSPSSLQAFGGLLFFSTEDGGLWQSDGTSQGTFKIRDLVPSNLSGQIQLVPAGSHLFFPSYDAATGTELWAIDGP